MPFDNVELVDGVFTEHQEHDTAAALTEDQLGRAEAASESVDGHPGTRAEVATAAPVVAK